MKYYYYFKINKYTYTNNKFKTIIFNKIKNNFKYSINKIYLKNNKIIIPQSEYGDFGEYLGWFAYEQNDINGEIILKVISNKIEKIINQKISNLRKKSLMSFIPWLIYAYE
ncbi:Uncharacterised protein [Mycoplasmopsis maculosa]|uniref:Uncharacterized protein n=1 Tax=Mycoplasmopsis maculosa TaxID=114885 RepID=A0A449B3S3_9BACT|nr:hypothetical protein [Mycoplasmopsis maculosa]VEU75219.1 Uncharacterised protein [Mycoplasmopsis maculosa]